jgi:hypothetical protein
VVVTAVDQHLQGGNSISKRITTQTAPAYLQQNKWAMLHPADQQTTRPSQGGNPQPLHSLSAQ